MSKRCIKCTEKLETCKVVQGYIPKTMGDLRPLETLWCNNKGCDRYGLLSLAWYDPNLPPNQEKEAGE